jgi:phosphatidate cytidylyltransferase
VTSPAPSSEVRTRLVMGSILAVLAAGILVGDWLLEIETGSRLYPCLMVCVVGMAGLAAVEMRLLLDERLRSTPWLTVGGCAGVLLAVWPANLGWRPDSMRDVAIVFAAVVLVAFLYEMARFREPDGVVVRLALATWTVAYLGFLPAFLVDLRWWPDDTLKGVTALVLVIFVPKGCDIGAYFTGRAFGRHRMTPYLSPKKTWEGLAGGLVLSMLLAVTVNRVMSQLLGDDLRAAAFGVVVGLVGVLGDLGESLIKRDCGKKDAATMLPGFGGVLDVIDSILFAAPVAWVWLRA